MVKNMLPVNHSFLPLGAYNSYYANTDLRTTVGLPLAQFEPSMTEQSFYSRQFTVFQPFCPYDHQMYHLHNYFGPITASFQELQQPFFSRQIIPLTYYQPYQSQSYALEQAHPFLAMPTPGAYRTVRVNSAGELWQPTPEDSQSTIAAGTKEGEDFAVPRSSGDSEIDQGQNIALEGSQGVGAIDQEQVEV